MSFADSYISYKNAKTQFEMSVNNSSDLELVKETLALSDTSSYAKNVFDGEVNKRMKDEGFNTVFDFVNDTLLPKEEKMVRTLRI